MKHTTLIGAALLSFVTAGFAATTVTVNNFNFPALVDNGITITDNAGTPLTGVAFSVGTLAAGPLGSPDDVRNAFTPLGSGSTPAIHFTTTAEVAASPQDLSQVYVVFTNGLAGPDEDFIVFEGDGTWVVEDQVLGGTTSVKLQASTLLYGIPTTSNNTGVTGPRQAFTNGVTFGIPEPSTSLLAGLAGLALFIRRKR